MTEESWDDDETRQQRGAKVFEQRTNTQTLGIGRSKLSTTSNTAEPAPGSRWNGGGSGNSVRPANNDENSKSGSQGTFGQRSERGGFQSGAFRSGNDGNSRGCFNCQQPGHMSRECPEPPKMNRTSFQTGSTPRTSMPPSFGRSNENRPEGDTQAKGTFTGWQGGAAKTEDSKENDKRGGFTGGAAGFRGGRGGFNAGDRGARGGGGGGGSNCYNCDQPGHISRDCPEPKKPRDGQGGGGGSSNCYNCNQPGHISRDCPEPKKPRDGQSGGGAFFGSNRKNDKVSDDIFDQPAGRSDAIQAVERYIPPPAPTTEEDIFGVAVAKGENFGKYHRTQVRCTPEGRVRPIEMYEEGNLATQILSNIRRAHFEEPTPIQRYTIPSIRQQDDIMACAQTGSGKTAAFLLPIISNLLELGADELAEKHHPPAPFCLVVSPTRELALQTEREARKFAYQTPVIPCSAVGGHDMFAVTDRLREGCHILSATTGRLKDMVEKGRVSLKKVKYFVLDEADRMLDTGFEPDIRKLEDLGLPPRHQRLTAMFSATFPEQVQRLAKHFLRDNYIFLAVGTLGGANEDISQSIELVSQTQKKDRLFQLLEENLKSERCLIFVETKRSADYIGALLSQRQLMSTTMHGDRTQRQRHEAVEQFTNGKCPILVATSVAARGLDFPLIGYVVNYDLPDSTDFYIHRIGRTGRAGHLGRSISFFDQDRESDRSIAPELVQRLAEAGQEVPAFLQQYTAGGVQGLQGADFKSKLTDTRSNAGGTRSQATGLGGTTSAGAATTEDWD